MLYKSNLLTLEPCNIYLVGIYFVSIDARAQVAIILLACGPCVVILNCLGQVCTLGKAPHTKKTLPDFREWCQVTRHSRVPRVDRLSTAPRFWGVTESILYCFRKHFKFIPNKKKENTSSNFLRL